MLREIHDEQLSSGTDSFAFYLFTDRQISDGHVDEWLSIQKLVRFIVQIQQNL